MRHRAEVALIECASAISEVVRRRREVIGPMSMRYAPEFRHRSLIARDQRLERLRKADHPRLPLRVRKHEVIDQMVELLAADRDAQIIHRREVALSVLT